MKQNEYQAQFATWAVMASQLILSADLRTLQKTQPDCFKLLLNSEIIAVNQDKAAHAPKLVLSHNVSSIVKRDGHNETRVTTTAQAFARPLHNGSVAVVMLNRQDRGSLTMTLTLAEIGLQTVAAASAAPCKVRDLIAQADLPDAIGNISASVGSHEAHMVRVSCGGGSAVAERSHY